MGSNLVEAMKMMTSTMGNKESLKVMRDFKCKNLDDVDRFEKEIMEKGDFDVEKYNSTHMQNREANGMHARFLVVDKGDFITGRIHHEEYIDCMVYGKMHITSFMEDGTQEEPETVEGFQWFEGKPGRKRIGEALEDSLWMTVDRTNEAGMTYLTMDEYRESKKLLEVSV